MKYWLDDEGHVEYVNTQFLERELFAENFGYQKSTVMIHYENSFNPYSVEVF